MIPNVNPLDLHMHHVVKVLRPRKNLRNSVLSKIARRTDYLKKLKDFSITNGLYVKNDDPDRKYIVNKE